MYSEAIRGQSLLTMAKVILASLYFLTILISPALTTDAPKCDSCESHTFTETGSVQTTPVSETSTFSAPDTSGVSTTSLPSNYTLVTTAKPTDSPWSVSYSGYSSLPTNTTSTGASASASGSAYPSGVRFHPDGSSPGFYCEYPTLYEWQPCNTADSRECWLQQTRPSKLKERCNCTDDEPEEINIHTDCWFHFSLKCRKSHF